MKYGIIVHGGAWSIPDDVKQDHIDGVKNAIQVGQSLLKTGRNALDIVEEVIKVLEDDPTFDAGIGSHFNSIGEVEMDAIIADQDYNIGSVCAIRHVQNPISVARAVMENTEHIVLVGNGASDFAHNNGFEFTNHHDLLVGRELERFNELKENHLFSTKDPFDPNKSGFGTVGCVVKDKEDNLAIGVSTGGTPHKLAGRVGDTSLWGAGGYVTPIAGSAGTGFGEDLIRVLMTNRVVSYIQSGISPQEAAEKAIEHLFDQVDGRGGVITLSQNDFGLAFNTKRMAFAIAKEDEEIIVGIEPEDL